MITETSAYSTKNKHSAHKHRPTIAPEAERHFNEVAQKLTELKNE